MINTDVSELATIVLRTTMVYGGLLILLRLAGKRELGQMRLFDLIVILVIANAVQNAMVGSNTSVTGGLLAAATLVGINWIVGQLGIRNAWFGHELSGTPTMLVFNGQLIEEHMRREGITTDEVLMALREHGIDEIRMARLVVLEVDGTISVIPVDAPLHRTRRRIRGRKPTG